MLVLKKMSPKKIAIYLAIMCIMLGSTGLMLYQNYKLSDNQGITNTPAQSNGLTLPAAQLPAAAENHVAPSQPLDVNKLKNGGGFDLTIFSSEKFKALEENAVSGNQQPEKGKRDPFQP